MIFNDFKAWSIDQKISFSVFALFVIILICYVFVSFLIGEDVQAIKNSPIGEKISLLAKKSVENNLNETLVFKEVNGLIEEADSAVLNRQFYVQIAYNLFAFLGLALLLGKLFLANGIKSFTLENKTPILFVASIIVAINIQVIGSDALKLNEILGLDYLQELITYTDKENDQENMILQYVMLLPNAERGWLITIIGLALIPAIGEELMFRGYLMKLFSEKFNTHNGIALSALLFALVHFNITNFFYYFVLGVVLGYMYYWGKNLLFPIIVHFINNALVVVVYLEIISNSETNLNSDIDFSQKSYSLMAYFTVALCLVIFFMNYKRSKYIIK
jgi:membrane protease YdiL (CAAX protease family)